MSTLQIETIQVYDANGQPYQLRDACFDVDGMKRLCAELTALRAQLETANKALTKIAEWKDEDGCWIYMEEAVEIAAKALEKMKP